MNKNTGNTKIITIVAVLIIVALAWLTLSKPKTQTDELIRTGGGAAQMSEIEKDMINMLSTVGKIEINNNIFKNKAFLILQDRSRNIIEEPAGRVNPFAPIDAYEDFTEYDSAQHIEQNFMAQQGNSRTLKARE